MNGLMDDVSNDKAGATAIYLCHHIFNLRLRILTTLGVWCSGTFKTMNEVVTLVYTGEQKYHCTTVHVGKHQSIGKEHMLNTIGLVLLTNA